MPTLEAVLADRASYQREVQARTLVVVAALWRRIASGKDATAVFTGGTGQTLVSAVTVAQTLAATGASEYVAAAVGAQGGRSDALDELAPGVFAGTTADGAALDAPLYVPIITAKQKIAQGFSFEQAFAIGYSQLTRFVLSEVANSARLSDGSALALDRTVTSYTRKLNPPSCGRCLILAGKVFRRNEGFQRHPHCDCFHVPSTKNRASKLDDPAAAFRSMTSAQQDAAVGKAQAEAIRNGSDLSQVVNAQRGMRAAGDRYTTEGTTKRGLARATLGKKARLTPAAILAQYGESPERYHAALKANGYLA